VKPTRPSVTRSLAFRIGVVVVLAEIVISAATGAFYTNNFDTEVDRRISRSVLLPGTLMNAGLLDLDVVGDDARMRELVGEELVDAFVIGTNGDIFYSLRKEYVGLPAGSVPQIDSTLLTSNLTSPVVRREDEKGRILAVSPLRGADGHLSFSVYIEASTAAATAQKSTNLWLFVLGALAMVVSTSIVILLAFKLTVSDPLQRILNASRRMEAGDLTSQVEVADRDELGDLARAFNQREERYRAIFKDSPLGIFRSTVEGRFLEVNPAFATMLGYDSPEAVIHEIHDIGEQIYARAEDRRRIVSEQLESTDVTQHLLHLRRRDGAELIAELHLRTVREAADQPALLEGIVEDITERERAEEALRVSQRKLALHIEQTLLGVIEWDTDFRAREWNPAAEAIFGYSREEAVGRRADELILPESARSEIESVWQSLMHQAGGQFSTNENVTKDGRTILCEWVNTPLTDDNGDVVGVMSLAQDITERRQAEELRIAKEAAERASVAKSTFLANMSHEIRTPMNAILGFSQLMRRDKGLSEHQRQQLDIINSSGEHLLALINDVLEMSKVEAGRISTNPTAFSLQTLLDEMNSLFGLRAEAKGLDFHIVRSEDLPRFVVTDENKLRQILVNLLGNAVKFTDAGSVELRVAVRHEEGGGLRLLVEVEDTGRGIAPEDMGRLFQYFEQVAAGREMETGTGLGLAISREFVHLLGGEIVVESTLGVGSTFKFDIAVEQATAEAVPAGPERRHVTGLRPGEPRYRVLVADDSPDNRELLVQLLEPIGFSVRSVSDGKAALEEYEEWRPQLILMDMRMPEVNGYEATRRIRAMPGGADVAIIGVTASVFAEMRQGMYDAGVDEYLGKPFHESELLDKIAQLLGARYVYEEAEGVAEEPAEAFDAAALASLPKDLTDRIRQATINADFDAVVELTEEVGRFDEHAAAALRASAERFDAEHILAALPTELES